MPVLSFLLNFPPALSVTIFSLLIAIIINIFYKILVNQNDAKQIKARVKEVQNDAKAARKSGDMKRSSELMSEAMKENSKMMRLTMKPMIVSMVIVIIFLPLIAELYNDIPVAIDSTGLGVLKIDGQSYALQRNGNELKINDFVCNMPCVTNNIAGYKWEVAAEGNGIKFARIVSTTPIALPYFGNDFGWLGWYIISSIPLMIVTRRLMKIAI